MKHSWRNHSWRRAVVPVALVAAVFVATPGTAVGATAATTILAIDNEFDPESARTKVGGDVVWEFPADNNRNHTSTDSTGLALWNSGTKAPGTTFTYDADVAGLFTYRCTIHSGMNGTLGVKDNVKPKNGSVTDTFRVTWARTRPNNVVFDVQFRNRALAITFTDLAVGTTDLRADFVPDDGPGTYEFRSRARNTVTGKMTGFSPVAKIVVTSM
jgi:plastocyanin